MVEHTFPQEPFRTCYEQHKTPSMDNDTIMCIHQCYYDAIGFFPGGEKLDSANYLKYKDSLDPALQEPFTFALLVCAKITVELIKRFASSVIKMRCNPISYLFNRCLMEVDMANCPKERWIN
uniref:Uncharacterized protein n=1 Tax=Anopheles minimus TaxID=112268 RepID=A0A182WHR6_9DIPT